MVKTLEMAEKEVSIGSDGHFATVLVGLVDNDRREVTMANAGHPPVLLLNHDQSEFVEGPVGVPLGIGAPAYESVTFSIAPDSTLIAYTDGLTEPRSESLEAGMEGLRKGASVEAPSIDELLRTSLTLSSRSKFPMTILRSWRFDGSANLRPEFGPSFTRLRLKHAAEVSWWAAGGGRWRLRSAKEVAAV